MKYIALLFCVFLTACYMTCPCQKKLPELSVMLDGQSYQFKNGRAVGTDATLLETGISVQNTKGDKAFVFVQQTSGSGIFYYVTAAFKTDKGWQTSAPLFLGDRIKVQKITWTDEGVFVDYLDRRPNEPMAFEPTIPVHRQFIVKDYRLMDLI